MCACAEKRDDLPTRQRPQARMAPLPLESGVVYGPLFSRRLGLSLGVNVLPTQAKVCSYDCIYCHYGYTDLKTLTPPVEGFATVRAVVRGVTAALRQHPDVTAITFSGNGEPTLHPYFPVLAFELRRLRDRLCPDAKLVFFSNATTAGRPEIRKALRHIDVPILKLDAGEADTWARVNQPPPDIDFQTLVAGLKQLDRLVIQSVFIDGAVSNVGSDAVAAWLETLVDIRPTAVQIYSTDYPVARNDIRRVPPYVLRRIATEAEAVLGVPVRAYWLE